MRVGLVLGSGGVVGGSWLIGALQALEDETGWRAAEAERVVGTSAGAVIGALLADGVDPRTLAAHLADDVAGETRWLRPGMRLECVPPPIGPGSWRLAAATLAHPHRYSPAALMAAWLPRGVVPTAPIRGVVDALVTGSWPRGAGFRAVAADYATARRVVFGEADAPAATVGEAVAASCAIPGFYRPVTIAGRRYVDGGVWSASNLDVLRDAGLDLAVCLNPMTSLVQATGGSPVDRMAAIMRAVAGRRLGREAALLRSAGTEVLILQPSADDVALMGFNLMSPGRRLEVMEQARRTVADHVRALRAEGATLPGATGRRRPRARRRPAA